MYVGNIKRYLKKYIYIFHNLNNEQSVVWKGKHSQLANLMVNKNNVYNQVNVEDLEEQDMTICHKLADIIFLWNVSSSLGYC